VGLTSPALSYLLGTLAAGLLLLIISCWRLLAKRRLIALRALSLISLQACVLALIFVTVNRTGEFYSSWSDLFGSDTASASVIASPGVDAAKIRPVVVISRTQVSVPGDKAAAGTLESVTFTGQLSGLTVPGRIFLPAGYRDSGPARYPVLVVISDGFASPSSPYGAIRMAEDAAREIAAGQLEPMIMVFLPAELSAYDQGCLNVPAQPATASSPAIPTIQGATFFAQDVPAIMESDFAARSTPGSWALLGDSSGGYCAVQLALANSWVFSVAAAPDGAYTRPPGTGETAGSPQLKQQDNLVWLVRNQPMQPVSVLFTGPSSGPAATRAATPFLALARRPMRVSAMAVDSGSWPLAGVLNWIGQAVSQHPRRAADRSAGTARGSGSR